MKRFSSMMVRTVIALLCIMLVSVAVVITFGTQEVSRNQYEANVVQEEANLDSLALVLDQTFYDYLSLATQITNLEELRPYRLLKTDPVSQLEARTLLQAFKGANRSIIDICLYDLKQNFFVTSVASYQPHSFIQSYYRFDRIDQGSVYELFCSPTVKGGPLLLPVGKVYTESNTPLSDSLLFLTPLPQRSLYPYATLGIVIQINDIREQLSIVAGENAARIVDANGMPLVSVGEDRMPNGFSPDEKVRVFCRKSERLDLVYETYIKEETLYRTNLASSRLILTLGFLALVVALICLFFAKWVNQPIQMLMTTIGGSSRFVDESSYIRQHIYDLGKIVEQNGKYVNELLVRRLLAGQPLHEDELARCESILKKDYAHCVVMTVRLARRLESVLTLTTKVCEHALVNILQDAQLETLVCIIACDELDDEVLKLAANLISEPPMKGASVAAIGTIEDDLLQLRDSRLRAGNHMKEMLYQGRSGIEIATLRGNRKNAYPSEVMHLLRNAVRSDQPSEIHRQSNRLCEILLDPLTSPETGAIVAYDLALLFPELSDKVSCSAQLFCESLRQCVENITSRLASSPTAVCTAETVAEPTQQDFVDAIDDMLEQPGFGISTISEHFGMSDSAFSHMFKRSFGVTFISYVNQRKIQRAKTLLSESNLSLDALADQLGYSSASNFVRMFKKYEGITPGAFRQSTRNTCPLDT